MFDPESLARLPGRAMKLENLGETLDVSGLPEGYRALIVGFPLVGVRISLDEADDISGLGAEIRVMDEVEVLAEAAESYPGIVATACGYFPFGICLEGSGDPYFVRCDDGAIVRIPHDAVSEDGLSSSMIEVVADSLKALLSKGLLQ